MTITLSCLLIMQLSLITVVLNSRDPPGKYSFAKNGHLETTLV